MKNLKFYIILIAMLLFVVIAGFKEKDGKKVGEQFFVEADKVEYITLGVAGRDYPLEGELREKAINLIDKMVIRGSLDQFEVERPHHSLEINCKDIDHTHWYYIGYSSICDFFDNREYYVGENYFKELIDYVLYLDQFSEKIEYPGLIGVPDITLVIHGNEYALDDDYKRKANRLLDRMQIQYESDIDVPHDDSADEYQIVATYKNGSQYSIIFDESNVKKDGVWYHIEDGYFKEILDYGLSLYNAG